MPVLSGPCHHAQARPATLLQHLATFPLQVCSLGPPADCFGLQRRLPEALFVISAGGDDWLLYASQKMQDVATMHAYISKLVSAEVRFIRVRI